jgi:hypothetical protein
MKIYCKKCLDFLHCSNAENACNWLIFTTSGVKNGRKRRQIAENGYQRISGKLGTLLSKNHLKPIIISKTFTFF